MAAPDSILIQLHGETRAVAAETSVAALIAELGLRPEEVAVEVNQDLVPREARPGRALAAGDRVELVTLVGGG